MRGMNSPSRGRFLANTVVRRAAVTSTTFCEFLWPVLNSLVPRAMDLPQSCNEFFILTQLILKKLLALQSTVVRANELVHDCIIALTGHETSEVCKNMSFSKHPH